MKTTESNLTRAQRKLLHEMQNDGVQVRYNGSGMNRYYERRWTRQRVRDNTIQALISAGLVVGDGRLDLVVTYRAAFPMPQ